MKNKIGIIINGIGIVILICLLLLSVGETEKILNENKVKPDVTYEFCNKNISWD